MKYGYSRTPENNPCFEKENEFLRLVGCQKIMCDIIPSYHRYGPHFLELIQNGHKGDLVVVYSFSRLCNTVAELSTICSYLLDAKMGLISLKEQINSGTFEGAIFLHSMSEIALDSIEKEYSQSLSLKF